MFGMAVGVALSQSTNEPSMAVERVAILTRRVVIGEAWPAVESRSVVPPLARAHMFAAL